jgi:hypothetical protein
MLFSVELRCSSVDLCAMLFFKKKRDTAFHREQTDTHRGLLNMSTLFSVELRFSSVGLCVMFLITRRRSRH